MSCTLLSHLTTAQPTARLRQCCCFCSCHDCQLLRLRLTQIEWSQLSSQILILFLHLKIIIVCLSEYIEHSFAPVCKPLTASRSSSSSHADAMVVLVVAAIEVVCGANDVRDNDRAPPCVSRMAGRVHAWELLALNAGLYVSQFRRPCAVHSLSELIF